MSDVINLADYREPGPREYLIELVRRLLREKATDPAKWGKELRDEIHEAIEAVTYDGSILRNTKVQPEMKLQRLLDMLLADEFCGRLDALDDVLALTLPPGPTFHLRDLL
jgi:hypothetical protein